MEPSSKDSVQVFGKKKTSIAVAICKRGKGLIKVNGQPLSQLEPQTLRTKCMEPVYLLGQARFNLVCIACFWRRVGRGGHSLIRLPWSWDVCSW